MPATPNSRRGSRWRGRTTPSRSARQSILEGTSSWSAADMGRHLLAALCAILLLGAGIAAATPIGPSSLQVLNSSSRTLPPTSNSSIDARGGNVTQVNIDALSITKTWQGYYGNITGNIHLDDAANQSFYIWGNGTLTGEVYA